MATQAAFHRHLLVFGPSNRHPGPCNAIGYFAPDFQLALAVGRVMSELISDGQTGLPPDAFAIGHLAERPCVRAETSLRISGRPGLPGEIRDLIGASGFDGFELGAKGVQDGRPIGIVPDPDPVVATVQDMLEVDGLAEFLQQTH